MIERGALSLAGVEVKASGTVTKTDFRGLRRLRQAAGDPGSRLVWFFTTERLVRASVTGSTPCRYAHSGRFPHDNYQRSEGERAALSWLEDVG